MPVREVLTIKRIINKITLSILAIMIIITCFVTFTYAAATKEQQALAATTEEGIVSANAQADSAGSKALAASIAIGLAAGAGALGMGIAISKSLESIARQPEAEDKIRASLLLGLVFVETAIIYALVIAILIIFVL